MKRIFTKKFKHKKGITSLVSVGFGKNGPYAYAGLKTKKGFSFGASIGTEGKQAYASYNHKKGQIRLKHNFTNQTTIPSVKLYKKKSER
ncbi:MAG: hypothetical protein ABIF85_07450 [Nanoarchaeota archaeon]